MRSAAVRPAGGFARWGARNLFNLFLLAVSGGFAGGATESNRSEYDPAAGLFSGREPVPRLTIEVSESDLARLAESTSVRDDAFRPEVTALVRDGTNVLTKVALHLKGARGSFRAVDGKPALTLRFSENLKHQRFHGLEKISLNNSVQDSTYLCEWLGRRFFAEAGLPVPRAAHAIVSLNGRPLGIYVLLEGWNKQFLRRHFSDPSGNFYEPAYHNDLPGPFEVKSGDLPGDHRALHALTAAIELPPERRWAALEEPLDRDRFVTGMALEILLMHWDGYCGNQNNYRIFHDRASGRLVFFPHGLDQLLGLRRGRNSMVLAPRMRGRVADAIVESTEGLEHYYDRMGWLLTNVWDVARWTAEAQRMARRLRPLVDEEPDGNARFDEQVERLIDQLTQRHADASRQLAVATTPIHFTGSQPTILRNWRYWTAGNSFGMGFRQREDGPGYLRLYAGRFGSGSAWRTTVRLEPGRYRFEGRVEHDPGTAASPGFTIRSSLGQNTRRIGLDPKGTDNSASTSPNAKAMTGLVHEFSVTQLRYVELFCEANGATGWIDFDPESLKLSRLK
jgi:hypothetical protein